MQGSFLLHSLLQSQDIPVGDPLTDWGSLLDVVGAIARFV